MRKIDFGESVGYPLRDPQWLRKISLGVGLGLATSALGFAAIYMTAHAQLGMVGFLAMGKLALLTCGVLWLISLAMSGYVVRALQFLSRGQSQNLPNWTNPFDLVLQGLKLFGVGCVYLLIPGGLLYTALHMVFASMITGMYAHSGFSSGIFTLGGLGLGFVIGGLGFLSLLGILFLMPMVTLRLATQGVGAALRPAGVVADIRQGFKSYLFIVAMVGCIYLGLGTILGWVPSIGGPLFACAQVYLNLVMAHMLSQYRIGYLA